MTDLDRIADAIRGFDFSNYGLDDVNPRSQYAEWVPDLAEKILAALERPRLCPTCDGTGGDHQIGCDG